MVTSGLEPSDVNLNGRVEIGLQGESLLVSIIIPVYNVCQYLECCLQSVLKQTYHNIEIILVDDGSTDGSGDLCDEYARKDTRIITIHQDNQGQAAARNKAFSVSKGAFIVYIDSDDYVSKNYVELLVKFVIEKDADIVQCEMRKFRSEAQIKDVARTGEINIEVYTASTALEEFCYQRKFYAGPCCKIIRREILDDIPFPEDMGYEDMAIMFRLLGKAKKIILLPRIMYYYRQHNKSTMHNRFSDKKIDRIRIAEQLKEYIETYYPENIQAMKSRYLLAQLQLIMELPFDKKYDELRKCVKDNIHITRKDVIQDKKAKKSLRAMACASYGGIYLLMFLGRVYRVIFV